MLIKIDKATYFIYFLFNFNKLFLFFKVPHLPLMIMGFLHVKTEVYYPNNDVSQWKVCNPEGEDPLCSNVNIFDLSVEDHLDYLEENPDDYKDYCVREI